MPNGTFFRLHLAVMAAFTERLQISAHEQTPVASMRYHMVGNRRGGDEVL
jgi:hypothetical protein